MGLYKENLLMVGIIICSVTCLLDIASRFLIRYPNAFPDTITIIVIKLFLVSMVSEIAFIGSYFLLDALKEEKQYFVTYIAIGVTVLAAVAVFITGVDFQYYEETNLSIIGSVSYNMAFFMCWGYGIMFIITNLFFIKNNVISHTITGVLWSVVWIIGTAINYFFKNVLCASLSFSLALIVIMCLSENLEGQFNTDLEIFQYDSLITYLKLKFLDSKKTSLLYVHVFNDDNEYRKDVVISQMINESITLFKKTNGIRIYKIKNNELVICGKSADVINKSTERLKKFIDDYELNLNFANRTDSVIIYVEDIHLADSPVDLMNLLDNSKSQTNKNPLNVNVVRIDNELVQKIKDEMQMLKEIDNALENDGIKFNYQPVYSVKEHKFVSAEVLTRLKSMSGDIILPNAFIPVAEKYGRIVKLGEVILNQSCNFYKELIEQGIELEDISINFSSYQLEDPAIINSVIDAISTNKLNPSSLCIEITNAYSVRRKEDYLNNINRLVSFGVNLSLTGFGSNESNLDYIVGMPANLIRLDRNFVWRCVEDEKASLILDSIIEMVHDYNMKIVAVGVEDKNQFDILASKNVDYLQGIYISKPISKDDFINTVKTKVVEE